MPSNVGKTRHERGYGYAHVKAAARLKAAHHDGDICRKCGRPMYLAQGLEAGHPPGTTPLTALPDAIEHRVCNRRDGQAKAERSKRRQALLRQRRLPRW